MRCEYSGMVLLWYWYNLLISITYVSIQLSVKMVVSKTIRMGITRAKIHAHIVWGPIWVYSSCWLACCVEKDSNVMSVLDHSQSRTEYFLRKLWLLVTSKKSYRRVGLCQHKWSPTARCKFNALPLLVGFVVERVALGWVCLPIVQLFPANFIPLVLHTSLG